MIKQNEDPPPHTHIIHYYLANIWSNLLQLVDVLQNDFGLNGLRDFRGDVDDDVDGVDVNEDVDEGKLFSMLQQ